VNLVCGDSLVELKKLEENSIDLIATDPPYGYSFMNKDWDKAVVGVDTWKECLRVLKPGAFAFIMSSPRQDVLCKMILNLIDAGFRTDFTSIYWTYASGFPKAADVSKLVDRRFGVERELVGKSEEGVGKISKSGIYMINDPKSKMSKTYDITKPSTDQAKSLEGSYAGFQPKPAVEIVLVVMKPLDQKSYVDQALSNRKGITWLDDCRLGERFPANLLVQDYILNDFSRYFDLDSWFNTTFPFLILAKASKSEKNMGLITSYTEDYKLEPVFNEMKLVRKNEPNKEEIASYLKHWRENKGLSQKQIDEIMGWNTNYSWLEGRLNGICLAIPDDWFRLKEILGFDDKYDKQMTELIEVDRSDTAKLTKFPQNRISQQPKKVNDGRHTPIDNPFQRGETLRVNTHPTVKPLKLMSYLIMLGSREKDTILDPFCGSGTTCIAAEMLKRNWIGIDNNQEYIDIARARISSIINKQDITLSDLLFTSTT
jgi:DNA modification methylase